MQQLDLLSWQPEPELMEASQSSTPFRVGQRVIADGKVGSVYHDDGGTYVWVSVGNTATPHDRPTVQLAPAEKPAINQHALGWHYAGLHYYRRMMLRFMSLPSAETPALLASRRQTISHLQRLSEACLTKIKVMGGE